MKKILITGANSYIGTNVENWLTKSSEEYKVETLDMKIETWKEQSFNNYDVVFHVAGIAHADTCKVSEETKELYYKVNRDLTIEVAEKAKKEGVKQFIFMSSIIVYGDSNSGKRIIDKNTAPNPSNFYGNSKLQAEKGIRALENDEFRIVIVRPPMIYGKASKGNYPRLAKLAQKTPIFPNIDNERSMLHIDNLCEFIKVMIDHEESGLFFPQNKEYVKTSELVQLIGKVHGKKVHTIRWMNWLIRAMFGIGAVKKVFGNLVYEKNMSDYEKEDYRIRDFEESIKLTESRN